MSENIKISDSDNSNNENNKISDSDNSNIDNTNISNINIIINKTKDSSNILYTFAIISIITGGVIFLSAVILIIIFFYKKRKPSSSQHPSQHSRSPSEIIDLSINYRNEFPLYEYEPRIDKINPIIIIFLLPIFETKILVDYDKTIDELIKFYFKIIKRPDLYGDQSITFLINARNICPPYPNESVETLLNKIDPQRTVKIIVSDIEDKIGDLSA